MNPLMLIGGTGLLVSAILFGLWKNEQSEHRADLILLQAMSTRAHVAETAAKENANNLIKVQQSIEEIKNQQVQWGQERAELIKAKNDAIFKMEQNEAHWKEVLQNNEALAARSFRIDLNSMFRRFHENTCRTNCSNENSETKN